MLGTWKTIEHRQGHIIKSFFCAQDSGKSEVENIFQWKYLNQYFHSEFASPGWLYRQGGKLLPSRANRERNRAQNANCIRSKEELNSDLNICNLSSQLLDHLNCMSFRITSIYFFRHSIKQSCWTPFRTGWLQFIPKSSSCLFVL